MTSLPLPAWWGRLRPLLSEFYHAPYRGAVARARRDEDDLFMLFVFAEMMGVSNPATYYTLELQPILLGFLSGNPNNLPKLSPGNPPLFRRQRQLRQENQRPSDSFELISLPFLHPQLRDRIMSGRRTSKLLEVARFLNRQQATTQRKPAGSQRPDRSQSQIMAYPVTHGN